MKQVFKTVKTLLLCSVVAMSLSACDKDPKPDGGGNGSSQNVEVVDLGLSVKWATCNLGATKPEFFGNYYAWGEIEPKSDYSESTSVTNCKNIDELKSAGIIDANGNLTAKYDAATQALGNKYRMPTKAELRELLGCCQWRWTTLNDVNGYKVIGPNGNSIFLPAAGYRWNSSGDGGGSYGGYWSSTVDGGENVSNYYNYYYGDNYYIYELYFISDYRSMYEIERYSGKSIRPVCDKKYFNKE